MDNSLADAWTFEGAAFANCSNVCGKACLVKFDGVKNTHLLDESTVATYSFVISCGF